MYGTYPSQMFVAVTPSDTAMLSYAQGAATGDPKGALSYRQCRSIYVGTTGDLAVASSNNSSVTFKAVPAGSMLPIATDMVYATGTTASNIVALF